jgi:DNA-binding transcriptional LysR family regulator
MNDLSLLRTLLRVLETGSFSAAARAEHTSQPTISRRIEALEAELGARLLARSTRALRATEEGARFAEHAQRVLDAADEAAASVGRRRARAVGTLRLALPVVFGRLQVIPRLPRFLARHPDLGLELFMSDASIDLVGEAVDVAVRLGPVADQALVVRRVGLARRRLFAMPGYLAARGEPGGPADLAGHACIAYARTDAGERWRLAGPAGATAEVAVTGPVRVNSAEALREAVLAGFGIGILPDWAFAGTAARLVLPDWQAPPLPVQLVYPSRRFVALKLRAFIDFMAEELRLDPLLSEYAV